jgi:hypothetical protein
MFSFIKLFRIFIIALCIAVLLVTVKYFFHALNWEVIEQSSLHNSVISSVTFVIGFILSATIADYKESERIPADFAANLEDMYDDAKAIHQSYSVFDIDGFRKQLQKIGVGFHKDARKKSYDARKDIRGLTPYLITMETGGVPANFIVKLKQQQTSLLRSRHRVNYIQRIKFIPSANILARSIVGMVLVLLMLTNIDPFYGGLVITGVMTFILSYILILINVISTPFHASGKTRDDVSLFLINDAVEHLSKK